MARLKWHCHFIQKFELDTSIQYRKMNSSFDYIRNKTDQKLFKAWKNGQTGYPLIDAAMRCVRETGYLNFRLRSTVVSFLTTTLITIYIWSQEIQIGSPLTVEEHSQTLERP